MGGPGHALRGRRPRELAPLSLILHLTSPSLPPRPPLLSSPAPTTAPRHLALLAAAAVLLASPSADAKVVLAKSAPKKVFQGEASTPRERAAPAEKAAKKSAGAGVGGFVTPSIGPSVGVLALPGKRERQEAEGRGEKGQREKRVGAR